VSIDFQISDATEMFENILNQIIIDLVGLKYDFIDIRAGMSH
jgi:hypothetical protein